MCCILSPDVLLVVWQAAQIILSALSHSCTGGLASLAVGASVAVMLAFTAPILMLHTLSYKNGLALLRRSDYVWCECRDSYCVNTALSWVLKDTIDGISQHSAPRGAGLAPPRACSHDAMQFGWVLSCLSVGLLGMSHLRCSDQHVVAPSISLLLHPRSCHIVHLRSQRPLIRQGCRILNNECLSCRALPACF